MLDLTDWQNKKYQTRDGRPVRILCIDAQGEQPIVGLIPEFEAVQQWSLDGSFLKSRKESSLDLINAKTKREGWVNVYKEELFDSKESADCAAYEKRIACVKIEWEE